MPKVMEISESSIFELLDQLVNKGKMSQELAKVFVGHIEGYGDWRYSEGYTDSKEGNDPEWDMPELTDEDIAEYGKSLEEANA